MKCILKRISILMIIIIFLISFSRPSFFVLANSPYKIQEEIEVDLATFSYILNFVSLLDDLDIHQYQNIETSMAVLAPSLPGAALTAPEVVSFLKALSIGIFGATLAQSMFDFYTENDPIFATAEQAQFLLTHRPIYIIDTPALERDLMEWFGLLDATTSIFLTIVASFGLDLGRIELNELDLFLIGAHELFAIVARNVTLNLSATEEGFENLYDLLRSYGFGTSNNSRALNAIQSELDRWNSMGLIQMFPELEMRYITAFTFGSGYYTFNSTFSRDYLGLPQDVPVYVSGMPGFVMSADVPIFDITSNRVFSHANAGYVYRRNFSISSTAFWDLSRLFEISNGLSNHSSWSFQMEAQGNHVAVSNPWGIAVGGFTSFSLPSWHWQFSHSFGYNFSIPVDNLIPLVSINTYPLDFSTVVTGDPAIDISFPKAVGIPYDGTLNLVLPVGGVVVDQIPYTSIYIPENFVDHREGDFDIVGFSFPMDLLVLQEIFNDSARIDDIDQTISVLISAIEGIRRRVYTLEEYNTIIFDVLLDLTQGHERMLQRLNDVALDLELQGDVIINLNDRIYDMEARQLGIIDGVMNWLFNIWQILQQIWDSIVSISQNLMYTIVGWFDFGLYFVPPTFDLTNTFPFSLPWDFMHLLQQFQQIAPRNAIAPIFVFDIPFEGVGPFIVDMRDFEGIAGSLRNLQAFSYSMFLIFLTIKLTK